MGLKSKIKSLEVEDIIKGSIYTIEYPKDGTYGNSRRYGDVTFLATVDGEARGPGICRKGNYESDDVEWRVIDELILRHASDKEICFLLEFIKPDIQCIIRELDEISLILTKKINELNETGRH